MELSFRRNGRLWLLLLGVTLGARSAWSVEETDYERHFQELVSPFMDSAKGGSLLGSDGNTLTYHVFRRRESRPAVLILTGYAESWLTYGETALDLDQAGYDVYVMDHRGMGFSGRLAHDPRIAHIPEFQVYVDDARTFLHQVVLPQVRGPLFLLAHSMGGLVGAYLLEKEARHFRAAAFSAPLFELNTGMVPEFLALGVVNLQVAIGRGAQFAPGRGDFDPTKVDPSQCSTTHSVARCRHQLDLYQRVPETFIAGPSNQWVKEVIHATHRLPDLVSSFKALPILILQAEDDAFVRSGSQSKVCAALTHCELIMLPHTFHEILQEKDPARNAAMRAILRLFHEHQMG